MPSIINRGVILGNQDTDYIAGVNSPIRYEVLNPSGDWTAYAPTRERQSFSWGDTMACVSFSALNCVETQIKFLTGNEINLSDRFLAKASGTTPDGNYLWKVADTLRKRGCPLEALYPSTGDFSSWNEYYIEIAENIFLEALKTLAVYDIAYEFIPLTREDLIKHIKHAPIQIVVPGHAICSLLSENDIITYLDTYDPFIKQTPFSNLRSACKIVVTIKMLTEKEVKQLQALEGFNDPEGVTYWTGKPLSSYLDIRIQDKIKTLQNV